MIVSVVLHDLCRDQPYDQRMEWSLNTLAGAFRKLLVADRARGIMLMDRDNDRLDHLEHLFQHGLTFPNGNQVGLNDRIVLFGMTNDNASNLSSAADIALGAFRYCANTAVGNGREPVAREMFPDLAAIMWSSEPPGVPQIIGYGYHPGPEADEFPPTELDTPISLERSRATRSTRSRFLGVTQQAGRAPREVRDVLPRRRGSGLPIPRGRRARLHERALRQTEVPHATALHRARGCASSRSPRSSQRPRPRGRTSGRGNHRGFGAATGPPTPKEQPTHWGSGAAMGQTAWHVDSLVGTRWSPSGFSCWQDEGDKMAVPVEHR